MSEEMTVTLTARDGATTGPITMDQLAAATTAVVEPLAAQAADLVVKTRKCSTSYIQRSFAIGYNKAARIVEHLEELGIVTTPDSVGHRDVVVDKVPPELIKASKVAERLAQKKPPVKETAADRKVEADAADANYRVTSGELRQFIERFERLEAEKKDIAEQQKEVMSEAKARGYDTKVMRKVIALRKRDKDDVAEEEAVLEMYKEALGM